MDVSSNENVDFGTVEHWESFYANRKKIHKNNGENGPETYDWYLPASELTPILVEQMHHHIKDHWNSKDKQNVLMLGCGTSNLTEELYMEGFTHIKNVDFCSSIIEMMKIRYKHLTTVEWLTMDFVDMKEISNESIDIVIDKGGFDAVMSSIDWHKNAQKLSDELYRVIKKSGIWIMISFGNDRLLYIDKDNGTFDEIRKEESRWNSFSKRIKIPPRNSLKITERNPSHSEEVQAEDEEQSVFMYIIEKK